MPKPTALTAYALAALACAALLPGCRQAPDQATSSTRAVADMNRGVSLMGQYQYDQAAQAFQAALQSDPGSSTAKINLAIALFNRNRKEDLDLDRAGQLLHEVLQKEPDNLHALYFKGIVLQHIGKAEEAVPCFQKVVQHRPADGAAWYLLALCRGRLGQPAETEYLRAVQHRPYLYSAYYQLYQAAMRAGQETKAREYLETFKRLRESPLGESIELPQYNQMGDLALAQPLVAPAAPPIAKGHFQLKPARTLWSWTDTEPRAMPDDTLPLGGAAVGDVNRDGLPDLVVPLAAPGRLALLRQDRPGHFVEATSGSGLDSITNALSCALGDFDNDDIPDLFVAGAGGHHLLRGKGDGTFTDVTQTTGLGAPPALSRSALFLDADHDGDLDLLVCRAGANQLWNNNGDGSFTNIADRASVVCADSRSVLVLPGDLDHDRDMDLVVLREGQPAKVFLNELLGQYRDADLHGLEIRGDAGGALQDFNGDGALDLLLLGGNPRELKLFLGDGQGQLKASEMFAESTRATASWGPLRGFRVADPDLDGDLDILCLGPEAHLLLNDGRGRFVLRNQVAKPAAGSILVGAELVDLTGDLVPDLLLIERGASNHVALATGDLSPPSTAVALLPTGLRSRDGRTRSPASGYGASITVRAGLREQRLLYTGQAGGFNQSTLCAVFGLGGARQADYVQIQWPDGVAQVELAMAAGLPCQKISELQRKISSCPVLFAWNGQRFEFIMDFAGVGGLGYFSAPGVSAPPQVLEHVKIEPGQLHPRNGVYELRVTEPMEEAAYIDRLELLAIDHPTNQPVFPDERLALSGPPPTHELLVVDRPIFPVKAVHRTAAHERRTVEAGFQSASEGGIVPPGWEAGLTGSQGWLPPRVRGTGHTPSSGRSPPAPRASDTLDGLGGGAPPPDHVQGEEDDDCADKLARVDRVYAYEPALDRRYIGFCQPHTLELDFGDRLAAFGAGDKVFLFIHGFIEYPYSQTVYAAGQSRIGWEPIRVERQEPDGRWQTIVPDGGAPGGMARMMTLDLTGQVLPTTRKLRLTTNLEVFYDQIFVARHAGHDRVTVRTAPLREATLRRVGFAREYSPDGRRPLIYDYDQSDATAPFHVLQGAYTRYGPVNELLTTFDDRYVVMGPGDEVALKFDAAGLPAVPAGQTRSFVLVSHAYCKDMDLYTATPRTLEPLPFQAMSRYPYPPSERYPATEKQQAFLRTYNTRVLGPATSNQAGGFPR